MFKELQSSFVEAAEKADRGSRVVDVSKAARAAGIGCPVTLTQAVWRQHVHGIDSTEGDGPRRLWEVVWNLSIALRDTPNIRAMSLEDLNERRPRGEVGRCACLEQRVGDAITYDVHLDSGKRRKQLIRLRAVVATDSIEKPLITVMLPAEEEAARCS
jgi:hypothetical protein